MSIIRVQKRSLVLGGLRHTTVEIPPKDRLKCVRCNKPMKLKTHSLWTSVGQKLIVTESEIKFEGEVSNWDRSKIRNAIAWSSYAYNEETGYAHMLDLWCGDYDGAGKIDDEPLFCTLACAEQFAVASFRGGYRLAKSESNHW